MVEMNGVRLGTWRRLLTACFKPAPGTANVAHKVRAILNDGLAWLAECGREFITNDTTPDDVAPRCPGCYKAIKDGGKHATK